MFRRLDDKNFNTKKQRLCSDSNTESFSNYTLFPYKRPVLKIFARIDYQICVEKQPNF